MLVPVNLTGGTYKHKSLPLSAQVTRNFWPQLQEDEKERSKYILQGFYGQTLFGTQSGGVDRGMFEHKDVLYKVTGSSLYTVASDGTHTSRGTIAGSARCIFAPIGEDIVVVSNGAAYMYDVSTTTLSAITDNDLETPQSAAHLNNQVIYDGDGGRFVVSDVGDSTSVDGLNYATAESDADDIVRVYTFRQTLYLMGERTIELWWNSGQGNPPFDRIEGGILNVGLGALHSVANTDESMFLFADDRQIYSVGGSVSGVLDVISTKAMAKEIQGYATVSDAIGWTMKLEGQDFYVICFPTQNKTWVYPIGGEWFEWSSDATGGRNRANSYAYAFGKHLVADYVSGNIYELDAETYTENGETIVRLRDSAPITGEALGVPGKEIEMNSFELFLETGVGLKSGQGSDPVVMLSFSDDGGRTFSTEQWGSVGKSGQFEGFVVRWTGLGRFSSRVIRIRVSDPVFYSIYSAAAELEACI